MGETERQPLVAHIALSAAQLDDAGVPEDFNDSEMGALIDDFLLSYSFELREHVATYLDQR